MPQSMSTVPGHHTQLGDKAMSTTFERAAQEAIDSRSVVAFDVCAEHGQIFDNVKHMRWFRDAVANELNTATAS